MTTVVLGWDGLDYELVQRYGIGDEFGAETKPIETIVNDELGKPHTWELWPSIITGEPPAVHGIRSDEFIENNWSSPLLRFAATASKPIPDWIRWRVGRLVRGSGATIQFKGADYYATRNLQTVFDGRAAFPLTVPNHRSAVDERFDMSSDRGAELGEFMSVETDGDGETRREPTVAPDTFAGRIAADAAEKIGLVRHALDGEYDIIFVWLAYLDTAGHVAPTVDDPDGWMRDAYETAADYTALVRGHLDDDDTLICLSDHGLQDGEHTETACIGSWPAQETADVGSVLDIASAVDACTPRSGQAPDRYMTDDSQTNEVRKRLEDLGYVD